MTWRPLGRVKLSQPLPTPPRRGVVLSPSARVRMDFLDSISFSSKVPGSPEVERPGSFVPSTTTERNHSTSHRRGVKYCMPGVRVKDSEPIESAIRRFKKQCEKAGILQELKKREHYEKPSVRRKRKAIAARKRALRRASRSFY